MMMNLRAFVLIMIITYISINVVGNNAIGSKSKKEASIEALLGTWVNEDHIIKPGTDNYPVRLEMLSNGTIAVYDIYELPSGEYQEKIHNPMDEYEISDSWVDKQGSSLFQVEWNKVSANQTWLCILKVSADNNKLEVCTSNIEFPEEIIKDNLRFNYFYYYRQD
jgi:hypothetical protein